MTVAYLRSHSYESDGRLARYLNICKDANVDFIIIDWDRTGNKCLGDKTQFRRTFLYKAKTGSGFKNIFNLFFWNCYLLCQLIFLRNRYKYIHAADLDTLLPALLVTKLFDKKLVFDVYDKYTAARKVPNFLARFFDWLEIEGIKIAHDVILPHACRIKQLGLERLNLKKDVHIFENIPLITCGQNEGYIEPHVKTWLGFVKDYNICISYVGILESKHRGLENIISAVARIPEIGFIIAGSGELTDFVQESASKFGNILYVGKVMPQEAHYILSSTDIHVGFYYKTISNHLYASPNKYYEHLFYGKAMLTNCGVPPGDLVKFHDTGFSIDESSESIYTLLKGLSISDIRIKGINAKTVWDDNFLGYTNYLNNEYLKIIKNE